MSALVEARQDVKAEIARTDTKASLLLAFNLGALTGVWTLGTQPWVPAGARVVGGLAVAALLASIGLLLWVVRPRVPSGTAGAGFPHWATLTPDELTAHLAVDRTAAHTVLLAGIAMAKMRGVAAAVNWTLVAAAPLFVAALIATRG
ncbi:Pycsar system effector family protein [Streptomyces sp. NPDC054784]